jgi:hypothetical protein
MAKSSRLLSRARALNRSMTSATASASSRGVCSGVCPRCCSRTATISLRGNSAVTQKSASGSRKAGSSRSGVRPVVVRPGMSPKRCSISVNSRLISSPRSAFAKRLGELLARLDSGACAELDAESCQKRFHQTPRGLSARVGISKRKVQWALIHRLLAGLDVDVALEPVSEEASRRPTLQLVRAAYVGPARALARASRRDSARPRSSP